MDMRLHTRAIYNVLFMSPFIYMYFVCVYLIRLILPFSLPQEFDTNGSHDLDKGRTSGCMKTKLKFPEQGIRVFWT